MIRDYIFITIIMFITANKIAEFVLYGWVLLVQFDVVNVLPERQDFTIAPKVVRGVSLFFLAYFVFMLGVSYA